ncbi:MAG: hypothetical protein DRJ60_00735 [Thermoprotei archaeon]|nr:MAG: hypothetical protein DRJ60_00735 [Thermoprotei archaeon]
MIRRAKVKRVHPTKKVIASLLLFTLEIATLYEGALATLPKQCDAKCEFFRCAKKAIIRPMGNPRRGSASQGVLICRETGEECLGPKCQYATCIRNALLPNGICGLEYRMEKRHVRSIEQEVKKFEEKYSNVLGKFKGKKITEDML